MARNRKASTFADASEFAEMLEAAGDEFEGVNPKLANWEEGKRGRGGKKHRRN